MYPHASHTRGKVIRPIIKVIQMDAWSSSSIHKKSSQCEPRTPRNKNQNHHTSHAEPNNVMVPKVIKGNDPNTQATSNTKPQEGTSKANQSQHKGHPKSPRLPCRKLIQSRVNSNRKLPLKPSTIITTATTVLESHCLWPEQNAQSSLGNCYLIEVDAPCHQRFGLQRQTAFRRRNPSSRWALAIRLAMGICREWLSIR